MFKKWITMLLVVTMVMSLAAGCGASSDEEKEGASVTKEDTNDTKGTDTETKETASSDEVITLRVMSRAAGSDPKAETFERVLNEFEASHPNVEIQNDSVAEEGAYNNKLRADIATGNPPNVFYFPGAASVVAWAENGVIMKLDDMLVSDDWYDGFSEGAFDKWDLSAYGVDGRYGLPFEVNPEVVFYNKKLFEQAGIASAPETMEEFYVAIDKLNAAGIIPLATGAKDTWRTGHIFNNIIYKEIGVKGVVDLGARKKSWDDPEVVKAFAVIKDLKERNAFQQGFEGIDYNTEKTMFHSGMAAMSIDGAWQVGAIFQSGSEYMDDIDFFPFPYFEEKPEYKEDLILFGPAYFLSGVTQGTEKEMQIELGKYLTGAYVQQEMINAANIISPRKDVSPATDAPDILVKMMDLASSITKPGGDYSDYDTAPELLDKSRDAIIGMLLKNSPEEAATQVKETIDLYEANK